MASATTLQTTNDGLLQADYRWLGLQSYEEGLYLQEKLIAQKIAGDSQNYFLFLEHEPVYTIGRTQDHSSLRGGILPYPLHQIGRGGQATYHGPGQLVCYPILDLHLFDCDLHRYLRFLERVLIELLAGYGITAQRREGMTGVWIENRKIASLGIGVRKWISFHGLALNVCGDLSPFEQITPCGLSGVEITSIEKELDLSKKEQNSFQLSVEYVGAQLARLFEELLS